MIYKNNKLSQDVYLIKGLKSNLLGCPAIEDLELLKHPNDVSSNDKFWFESYPTLFKGLECMNSQYSP